MKVRIRSRYLKGFHHYVGRAKTTRRLAARRERHTTKTTLKQTTKETNG